jgi:hypothetical protein
VTASILAPRLTPPVSRPSPRSWWIVAAALFCCGWGGNQFTPLLLLYRRLDGYSAAMVDAFLGCYVLGLIPGLLIGGPLSDVRGRKPVMLAGLGLSALGSGVLALGGLGAAPLFVGRVLVGIAIGIAMAVGSSWVKELSTAPFDPTADAGAGARRASLWLTIGLGLGAGVAGVLAQWGPWPTALPYLVHVLVTLPVLVLLPRVPESRSRQQGLRLVDTLRVPSASHRRFLRVIAPTAPWIFGSAGIAYAVTPQLMAGRTGTWGLAYATLLTVVTLGAGTLVQPFAKRLDSTATARAILVSLCLLAVGMAVAALAAQTRDPWLGVVLAALLGGAYGVAVVSCLQEIQRIARPDELAGLTGVYYALSYLGFLLPSVLAVLSGVLSYPVMLLGLTALALVSLGLVASASTKHLPR